GPFGAGFTEARREDDRTFHALAATFDEQAGQGGGRRTDQRQIHGAGYIVQGGVGGHAEDVGHFRVDRVDLAGVVPLDQAHHGLVAAFGGVGRGADDGDRVGRQEV